MPHVHAFQTTDILSSAPACLPACRQERARSPDTTKLVPPVCCEGAPAAAAPRRLLFPVGGADGAAAGRPRLRPTLGGSSSSTKSSSAQQVQQVHKRPAPTIHEANTASCHSRTKRRQGTAHSHQYVTANMRQLPLSSNVSTPALLANLNLRCLLPPPLPLLT